MERLKEKIQSKRAVIGVIGLGYIGLSLLEAFGRAGFPLCGYDNSPSRVEALHRKETPYNCLSIDTLFSLMDEGRFDISSDDAVLEEADVMVISVPTSLDQYQNPDLSALRDAFHTVYTYLDKGKLVVLQSSTYPGSTEDELYPLLQKKGLVVGEDYFLSHVPEVVDPGNRDFRFDMVPRIVSGITDSCLDLAACLYETIGCDVVRSSSPRVAESAKLLQNAFRLVNISLVNELKVMFDNMGIDIWEVIEVASSKPFGFMPFYPSPGAGGDCIPTDPYYLVWDARLTHGPTDMIELAGRINEGMPAYVLSKIVAALNSKNKSLAGAKVLILGVTYKKDVDQIRSSPSLPLMAMAIKKHAEVSYHDPYVKDIKALPQLRDVHLQSIELNYETLSDYDVVVAAVDHSCYDWDLVAKHSHLLVDTRNVFNNIEGAQEKVFKA